MKKKAYIRDYLITTAAILAAMFCFFLIPTVGINEIQAAMATAGVIATVTAIIFGVRVQLYVQEEDYTRK